MALVHHTIKVICCGTLKMILANLGCYKLKAIPGVKTTSPVGANLRD
jgi:hypothetical protein